MAVDLVNHCSNAQCGKTRLHLRMQYIHVFLVCLFAVSGALSWHYQKATCAGGSQWLSVTTKVPLVCICATLPEPFSSIYRHLCGHTRMSGRTECANGTAPRLDHMSADDWATLCRQLIYFQLFALPGESLSPNVHTHTSFSIGGFSWLSFS